MGLFRVRDRFNKKMPDGYWMKGRCFLPGKRLAIADDSAVFKDTGAVIKNRKGKRNPFKTKANINISYTFFGKVDGSLRQIGTAFHPCRNAKVCRNRNFRITLEEGLTRGVDITGMRVVIVGWKGGDSPPTATEDYTVVCEVGNVI